MEDAPVYRIVCLSAVSEHCLSDFYISLSNVSCGTLHTIGPSVGASQRCGSRHVQLAHFTSALLCSKLSSNNYCSRWWHCVMDMQQHHSGQLLLPPQSTATESEAAAKKSAATEAEATAEELQPQTVMPTLTKLPLSKCLQIFIVSPNRIVSQQSLS